MDNLDILLNSLFNNNLNKCETTIVDDNITKEECEKTLKNLDDLKKDELFGGLFEVFIDYAKNLVENKYKELKEKETNNSKIERKEVDHSEEVTNEIDRPSNHVSVQQGLNIHKIVTEYVDTMIKPYSKGLVDDKVINDAYAGLYEFACWILNR